MNRKISNRKNIAPVALMLLDVICRLSRFILFPFRMRLSIGIRTDLQVKNALLDYKIQEQTNRNITSGAFRS